MIQMATKKKGKPKPTGPRFKDAPEDCVAVMETMRNKHHRPLKPAKIRVLMARDWQKKGGENLAMTSKPASSLVRCLFGIHGFIIVSEPYWNETWAKATNRDDRAAAEQQLRIAFDRELCHFAYADGKLKRVEAPFEFPALVKHWGVAALNPNPLVMAIREDMQLALKGTEASEDEAPQ